jgi:hypothetical protein
VNVLESTGIEAGPSRVARAPPLGVAGGVKAGERREAGGSLERPHSDNERVAGRAWGDCMGGRTGEAWAGNLGLDMV